MYLLRSIKQGFGNRGSARARTGAVAGAGAGAGRGLIGLSLICREGEQGLSDLPVCVWVLVSGDR